MRGFWFKINRWLVALRRLRSVTDVLLFLRICLFAAAVPLLLRLKMSRWQSLLETRKAQSSFDPAGLEKIVSLVESTLSARMPFVRGGCLTRGLTLYYFLTRAGLDVRICFGMGEVGGKFVGHCWLIKGEEPFLEKSPPQTLFTEVFRIPRPSPLST